MSQHSFADDLLGPDSYPTIVRSCLSLVGVSTQRLGIGVRWRVAGHELLHVELALAALHTTQHQREGYTQSVRALFHTEVCTILSSPSLTSYLVVHVADLSKHRPLAPTLREED